MPEKRILSVHDGSLSFPPRPEAMGQSIIENKEIKRFTVTEVLTQIELLAQRDNLTEDDFDLDHVEVENDKNDNLICLSISVKQEAAQIRNRGNILYMYMAKGDREDGVGKVLTTNISKLESDISVPDDFSRINVLLKYNYNINKWENAEGGAPIKGPRFRMSKDKIKKLKRLFK